MWLFVTKNLSDFRYQKLLKSLVNEAKQRVQEQIEATKKRKDIGNKSGGRRDTTMDWLEGDYTEKEKPGGRLHRVSISLWI